MRIRPKPSRSRVVAAARVEAGVPGRHKVWPAYDHLSLRGLEFVAAAGLHGCVAISHAAGGLPGLRGAGLKRFHGVSANTS